MYRRRSPRSRPASRGAQPRPRRLVRSVADRSQRAGPGRIISAVLRAYSHRYGVRISPQFTRVESSFTAPTRLLRRTPQGPHLGKPPLAGCVGSVRLPLLFPYTIQDSSGHSAPALDAIAGICVLYPLARPRFRRYVGTTEGYRRPWYAPRSAQSITMLRWGTHCPVRLPSQLGRLGRHDSVGGLDTALGIVVVGYSAAHGRPQLVHRLTAVV